MNKIYVENNKLLQTVDKNSNNDVVLLEINNTNKNDIDQNEVCVKADKFSLYDNIISVF